MSYNPSIPNIGDFTSISQKQMLANFQAINNTFFIDHIALTALEDVGRHNALTFRPLSGDPTTSSDQVAIYNKIVSGLPQLFFRPNSNATPIQLTNSNLNTVQTGAPGGTQSSFLAGPFTIYMGYVVNCPNGQVVTLLPSSSLKYVGISTFLFNSRISSAINIAAVVNISANQFTIKYDPLVISFIPAPTIYYMAIGQ